MTDITICTNKDCELAETCYRCNAEQDKYYQSFCFFEPINGECEHYVKMEKRNE